LPWVYIPNCGDDDLTQDLALAVANDIFVGEKIAAEIVVPRADRNVRFSVEFSQPVENVLFLAVAKL
jgi:hypothetical protein